MKRIKIITSWEEDAGERRRFFANLSYSDRLRYYFKLRNMSFNKEYYPKGKVFEIYHSHEESQRDKIQIK